MVQAWLDRDTSAQALDVLAAVTDWQMHHDRWGRAATILATVRQALADHDLIALRSALEDLELAGPTKATRIGATPVVPPPDPVLERLSELVHWIDPESRAGPSGPSDSGPGQRRAGV